MENSKFIGSYNKKLLNGGVTYMGINVIGWLSLIILGGLVFYQTMGLDGSFDPMLAEKVDYNMKKPESSSHH